ncbi:hypothetical protein GW17_00029795 [Ensete ventricosum]|nr:hypothetical protein GW17_00029795 [Ensete ventricosum]RZS01801.1 hypothetical protein BHM03_00031735 [Ensete ventricosum]
MEPRDGDLQDAYFPHPFDDAVVQHTPPPPVSPDDEEADQGDPRVVGAFEVDESQLVSSPFALAPAFEPSHHEDAAVGEEALPMCEAAAAAAAVETSGPVKRKRGRPPKAHGAGKAPVPKKKKEEEEVCFICFDGGDLVLCDRRWVCYVLPSPGALFRVSRFLFFFGLNLSSML